MTKKSHIKPARPESQVAVSRSTQSTSAGPSHPASDTQHVGKGDPTDVPITRGKEYGPVYRGAVDVTIPPNWTEEQDRAYALEIMGTANESELVERICKWIDELQANLTFAFGFLSATPCEPEDSLFHRLPVTAKVSILKTLIHHRSQDSGYLERFDCDLRRFLDVETICMPVLARYMIDPESVWLREMVRAHDSIVTAFADFSESLECEHEDCPHYTTAGQVELPSGTSAARKVEESRTETQADAGPEPVFDRPLNSLPSHRYKVHMALSFEAAAEVVVEAESAAKAGAVAEEMLQGRTFAEGVMKILDQHTVKVPRSSGMPADVPVEAVWVDCPETALAWAIEDLDIGEKFAPVFRSKISRTIPPEPAADRL